MKRLFQTGWSRDRDKLYKRARNDAQEGASIIPTDVFPLNPSTSLHGSNTMASRGADELSSSSSSPIGVSVLYNPSDGNTAVDIVFIHGLKGHREKTWTSDKASEPWPKALLPSEIPNARVLAYGYDADVAKATEMVSVSRIRDHAATFLKRLTNFRDRTDTSLRPIIFVCHSLGGLVCQAALARAHTREHLKGILEATRGILFLGTPHHGSALAVWAERLGKSVGVLKQTNTEILSVLTPESEVLAEIQDNFHNITQEQAKSGVGVIQITCFYEELPLPGIGLVVPQHSAVFPGKDAIGIHGNHHTMVKFSSASDSGFVDICDELRTWIKKVGREASVLTHQSTSRLVIEEQEENPTASKEKIASIFIVPYAKNKGFVERPDIFERLKREFCHGPGDDIEDARFRVCLYGLGGIGKTQIAIAYTYWLRKAHPEISVFWVYASNADRFRQEFSEIAEECDIPGRGAPGVDVLVLVNSWLQRRTTAPWFLVLDNCDDANIFFNEYEQPAGVGSSDVESSSRSANLARFIPRCGNGSILITTRNKQAGQRLVPGQSLLEVGPMNDDESVRMIREISGDSMLSNEAASALSTRLENLPLAIAQAAAFIQENCISVEKYLEILNNDDTAEVQLLSEGFEAVSRDTDIPNAVMATWVVSFEHIKRQNSLAAEILSLMAFFDRQAIQKKFMTIYMHLEKYSEDEGFENESGDDESPSREYETALEEEWIDVPDDSKDDSSISSWDSNYEAIRYFEDRLETFMRDGPGSIRLVKAFGILNAFSFIKENKNDTLEIHRLVQLATVAWLTRKDLASSFAGKALKTMNVFSSFHTTRPIPYEVVPHCQAVLAAGAENTAANNAATVSIRHHIAKCYWISGHSMLALNIVEANLESQRNNQHKEHYFRELRLKALILKDLDRNQEAKQILLNLIAIQPQDSRALLNTVSSLTTLYMEAGDYSEARDLLIGTIKGLEKIGAPFQDEKAGLMAVLSVAFTKLHDTKEAEEVYLQVLKTMEKARNYSKAYNIGLIDRVAHKFASYDMLQEAEIIYRQALPIEVDSAESYRFNVNILDGLADVLSRQDRLVEAIDLQRQAVRFIEQFQGQRIATILEASVYGHLALLQHHQWLNLKDQLSDIGDNELDFEKTVTFFKDLGQLYCMGLLEEAVENMTHARRLWRGIQGDSGSFVLDCTYHLATFKATQGRWEEAKSIVERCDPRSLEILGPEHR